MKSFFQPSDSVYFSSSGPSTETTAAEEELSVSTLSLSPAPPILNLLLLCFRGWLVPIFLCHLPPPPPEKKRKYITVDLFSHCLVFFCALSYPAADRFGISAKKKISINKTRWDSLLSGSSRQMDIIVSVAEVPVGSVSVLIVVDISTAHNFQPKARAQCTYRKMQTMCIIYIYTTN